MSSQVAPNTDVTGKTRNKVNKTNDKGNNYCNENIPSVLRVR